MKKRIISLLLATIMVGGLFPTCVFAASYGENQSGFDILSSMSPGNMSKPDGFDSDTLSPYGTGVGQAFMIQEFSELLQFVSWDMNYPSPQSTLGIYNYTKTDASLPTSFTSTSNAGTDYRTYNYTQGVAFDPTGSGRNDHVAFVGYDNNNKYISVWFYNAFSKSYVAETRVVATKDLQNSKYDLVDARNFVQITAGDYNGDGKDTVVIYVGDNAKLYSIELDASKKTATSKELTYNSQDKSYLHHEYSTANAKTNADRLGCSLATGDVNGDNIDDLIVLSYANDCDTKECWSSRGVNLFTPQLAVGFGAKGTEIANLNKAFQYIYEQGSGNTYNSMVAPTVSTGDIDGDGYNEIFLAGFKNQVKYNVASNSTKSTSDGVSLVKDTAMFAYFNCENKSLIRNSGDKLVTISSSDLSGISKGDSFRTNERIWQQFVVEAVAFDGLNTQEYLFLNGYIYKLDKDGNPALQSNSDIFKSAVGDTKKERDDKKFDANENFIYSVAVGNFNNDSNGKETIFMTVGYKKNDSPIEYIYKKVQLVYDSSAKQFVPGTLFDAVTTTSYKKGEYRNIIDARGDSPEQQLNAIVVAVDSDADSVVVKYKGKQYAYTDPNVIAFLQAAPYFEELEAGNSSTTYSYSESISKSTSTGIEISYGIGVATEVAGGPVKVAADAGYCGEFSEEFEKAHTETYTTTFEANDKNQIIIRRTLVYIYSYDVLTGINANGEEIWQSNGMAITVPQYPVMSSLSVEQYNEFAKAYNSMYTKAGLASYTGSEVDKNNASYITRDHALPLIDETTIKDGTLKYYTENEGNPFNYPNTHTLYSSNATVLGKGWTELSHSGGTSQQEYSVEESTTYTTVQSDGAYLNMTVMAGGDFLFGEAWAGVSTSLETLSSKGTSQSKITASGSGGAVQNLNKDQSMYKFNWTLVGWKKNDIFPNVPFIGYAVSGASAPSMPVNDLTSNFAVNSNGEYIVTLDWTSPSIPTTKRGDIKTFEVYDVNDPDTPLASVANPGEGIHVSTTVNVGATEEGEMTFIVIGKGSDGSYGIESNETTCYFYIYAHLADKLEEASNELKSLIENGDKAGEDAIKKAVDELTEAYKNADNALEEAYKKADSDLQGGIAQNNAEIEALKNALEAAQKSLEEAIDSLDKKLDNAIKDLNEAIADGDSASSDELKAAVEALTEAYGAADAILKADIDALSEKLDQLKKTTEESDIALDNAIKAVQSNLDKANNELNAAIKNNSADLQKKLEDVKNALEAADVVINNQLSNQKLKNEAIDSAIESVNSAIAAIEAAYKNADNELLAEIEALKKAIDELKAEKDANVKDLQDKMDKAEGENQNSFGNVESENERQQGELDNTKTVAIVGLSVAGVSLAGNLALAALAVINSKKILK